MTRSTDDNVSPKRRRLLRFVFTAAIPLSYLIPGPTLAQDASLPASIGFGPPTLTGLFEAGPLSTDAFDRTADAPAGSPVGRTHSPTDAAAIYERQCLDRLVKLMQIDTRSRQFLPGAVATAEPAGAPDLAGLLGDDARAVPAIQVRRFELMHRNCMAVNAGSPPLLTPNQRLSRTLSIVGSRAGSPLRSPPAAGD